MDAVIRRLVICLYSAGGDAVRCCVIWKMRAIFEKNKFSRLTSCTALAKSLTKDLYSCDTEAGQVYVFDVFLYDT